MSAQPTAGAMRALHTPELRVVIYPGCSANIMTDEAGHCDLFATLPGIGQMEKVTQRAELIVNAVAAYEPLTEIDAVLWARGGKPESYSPDRAVRIKAIMRLNEQTQADVAALTAKLKHMTDIYAKAMKDAGVSHYPEALVEVREARAVLARHAGAGKGGKL